MAAHERKTVIERMDSFPKQSVKQTSMERKRSLPGEKRRICYTWKTTGMCRLGSLCRYAHDEELAYVPPDYTHRKWSNAQVISESAAGLTLRMSGSTREYLHCGGTAVLCRPVQAALRSLLDVTESGTLQSCHITCWRMNS